MSFEVFDKKKVKFNQNWPNLSQICFKSPSDTRRKRIVSIELSYKTMSKLVSLQLELYYSMIPLNDRKNCKPNSFVSLYSRHERCESVRVY